LLRLFCSDGGVKGLKPPAAGKKPGPILPQRGDGKCGNCGPACRRQVADFLEWILLANRLLTYYYIDGRGYYPIDKTTCDCPGILAQGKGESYGRGEGEHGMPVIP
jgi:hypothetical protein